MDYNAIHIFYQDEYEMEPDALNSTKLQQHLTTRLPAHIDLLRRKLAEAILTTICSESDLR